MPFLYGSSKQPSMVNIKGMEVQLGEVVRAAWTKSGLSIEEWNALTEEEREENIELTILELNA